MLAILRVENIRKSYPAAAGIAAGRPRIAALRDVSLSVAAGTTFGIVGESGCGKSTLARVILRLLPADAGAVYFDNLEISRLSERRLRPFRRAVQIVFQDPLQSLSPRLTVEQIIAEPLAAFGFRREQRRQRVGQLLRDMQLPQSYAGRLPQQLSGGERQRVNIARALALMPRVVVLDEPVAAVDLSTQAQLLNLLKTLQQQYDLTYVFIAHDLSVIRHISDTVAVMFAGLIVEQAPSQTLFMAPRHPYTRELLTSMPVFPRRDWLRGQDIPAQSMPAAQSPEPPTACCYYCRCALRLSECVQPPPLREVSAGCFVRCWAELSASAVWPGTHNQVKHEEARK